MRYTLKRAGHADGVLLSFIREVADEPLVIDPASVDVETRENTWSLSTSVDERSVLPAAEVVRAFEECAAIVRERLRDHDGPVTFYVWHDEQAGQLRCSTSSRPRDRLPFGARVDPEVPLRAIVEEFLADPSPGRIPWDQPAEPDAREHVVRVWAVDLGRSVPASTDGQGGGRSA